MKKYIITFEGTSYDLLAEDGKKVGGFFVSVLVQANQPEDAYDLAYQKLIASEQYQAMFADHEHPNGALSVSEYAELLEPDPSLSELSGFVFYPEDGESTPKVS